jgi:alginate O-acetyltransferase complex protein AlgI
MLFNSLHFLLFFPVVIGFYFALKARYRWILLLGASYYFYAAWKVEYIFLILFSTLVDYWMAILMSSRSSKKERRPFLVFSLISNLGLLAFFKYYAFANESLASGFQLFGVTYEWYEFESLLLPVGISFYTFQTLSYSIEVYWAKIKAERHLGIFALYVSFFPQLVAGPIERFTSLGKQLRQAHQFSIENFRNGARLMLFGFFTKMVVADNLGTYVDAFYANPEAFDSGAAWLATLMYSLQIYGDFYGYSLIAIGAALTMGIKIMDNFRNPYFSRSIMEFWRRWHISLSTWFRDYLYIPLGGNRGSQGKLVFNVILVFLFSGLWHGANWTFVCWGGIHGVVYLMERFSGKPAAGPVLSTIMGLKTLLFVNLAWLFFRSPDFSTAKSVFLQLFTSGPEGKSLELEAQMIFIVMFFLALDWLSRNNRFDSWIAERSLFIRWVTYAVLIFGILAFGGTDNQPFIYFQF